MAERKSLVRTGSFEKPGTMRISPRHLAIAAQQLIEPVVFEADIIVVIEFVDPYDGVALVKQSTASLRPDKTRRSRDQYSRFVR